MTILLEPAHPSVASVRPARVPSARREAWLTWGVYVVAVHAQLLALALWRAPLLVTVAQLVLLAVTLASSLLSVVHDAGHNELHRRDWVNDVVAQVAVPFGLWVAHYRIKHRTHHKQANEFGVDEGANPHPLLRVHPEAPHYRWHRAQHLYAPVLYALGLLGDVRGQITFLRTGIAGGQAVGSFGSRARSFVAEKAVVVAVLAPYVLLAGPARFALMMAFVIPLASIISALVLLAGHANIGLNDRTGETTFVERAFTSTAAFATDSPWMRRLTGGMTHHQVHHLRPHVPRSTFAALHTEVIVPMAAEQDLPLIAFPSLRSAIAGHFRLLHALGR